MKPSTRHHDHEIDDSHGHVGDLRGNTKAKVVTLTKSIGFSTERAQVLDAFLSFPPKVSSSRVYLMERSRLRAFNIVWSARP